ncbi:adenylyltransferase/cytidyltransferase family protein [Halobacteriales archaeon Cl-PHB]
MTTVVAQGTFDLVHPGHVHYLEEAAAMGDELHVIIARDPNVTHKPDPILSAEQRRQTVAGLAAVDEAVLGHPEDVFVPLDRIEPDLIVLGHDQHHDEAALSSALEAHGHDCRVERASRYDADASVVCSSSTIVERILDQRADQVEARVRPPGLRYPHP